MCLMLSAASDSHARYLMGNFVSEGVSNIFHTLLIIARDKVVFSVN
jgi:hypothetical protein